LLQLLLLGLVIYFAVREGLVVRKQGRGYFLRLWNLVSVCSLVLAVCVAVLHLSRSVLSARQWRTFLQDPDTFTDFFPLARLNQVLSQMSAVLLFLLVLKASHQLRFMREWGVFGRTLRKSFWELLMVAVTLVLFLIAYSHAGHLLFHSLTEGYGTVSSTCLKLMGSSGRGLLSWRPENSSSPCSGSCFLFHISFALIRLVFLWILMSALLRNYQRARAELYRPAVDLQDYEMVELFLRRLKMWMGLSRAKEFRHKVRFEGMDIPPSRSSSTSDCKSLCLPPLDTPEAPPTPDSIDEEPTSSSPCSLAETQGLGLGVTVGLGAIVGGHGWKERAEMEATLRRILPAFDSLLQQLDRVTYATEELCRTECCLERLLRKSRGRGRGMRRHRSLDLVGQRKLRHKEGDRSTQVAESNKSPPRSGIRASVSERNLQKCGQRSWKPRKISQLISVLPTSLNRVDLSPQSTKVEDAGNSEKDPAKAAQPEGTRSSPKTHKAKMKRASNKVDPNFQQSSEIDGCANKSTPAPTPTSAPVSTITTPVPIPRSHEWVPPSISENLPSSVFNHPAHTTTNPTRKRKHKTPALKNKVHPNTDRPLTGHPKP
ncbi:hypothetical protein DNTS_030195, partial [Danionella cerebrum]